MSNVVILSSAAEIGEAELADILGVVARDCGCDPEQLTTVRLDLSELEDRPGLDTDIETFWISEEDERWNKAEEDCTVELFERFVEAQVGSRTVVATLASEKLTRLEEVIVEVVKYRPESVAHYPLLEYSDGSGRLWVDRQRP